MDYHLDREYLKKMEQTMMEILKLLPLILPMNSFFVATNNGKINHIIKAHNRQRSLISEGDQEPYEEALCKLVVEHGREPLVISNLKENSLTHGHPAAEKMGVGCLIGVPIYVNNKEVFGTLCAIDETPFDFHEEGIRAIKTMGELLSQVVTLEEHAIRDPLTGLYNRDFLELFFERKHRNQSKIALLFIKLNRFKRINEVFGHTKGDRVIQLIAVRLKRAVDPDDFLARFGGDRFIVMILDSSKREVDQEVSRLGQLILDSLSEPFLIDDQEIQVTASIGVAIYPDNGVTLESLLKNAEGGLDLAKENGGNTLSYYHPLIMKTRFSELETENELRMALHRGEIKLFYQPQVNLHNNETEGFETLIRWDHPKKGILFPKDFISIAEESGMIFPLGEWVLNKVCETKQKWDRLGYPPVQLSFNLSPRQFQDPNLYNRFKGIIEKYQVNPQLLNLEITETLVMNDMKLSMYLLSKFKELGVRIDVDDFGKGYSSLAYLRTLPIDTLKIDRDFVKDLEESQDSRLIIKAIIQMAESLQLTIISEGIETEFQAQMLKEYGSHFGQGYYFSRPIPEENIESFINREMVMKKAKYRE